MKASLKYLILAAGGAAAALAAVAAPAAGRFIHVDGTVSVRGTDGAVRGVRAGEAVNEKESILVGEGRAQIRFDDGGWVSLQPRTVFEVNEYPRREDGNIVLSLIKGGARAVTGLFSDRRPASFRMQTPNATIGIRGTSFQVTFCQQSCGSLPNGLYVTGGDGTTIVKNALGEIDLSRGRTAFVANLRTPPRESSVKPVAEAQETMTAQEAASTVSTTTGELRPGNFIYFEGTNGYTGPFQIVPVGSLGVGLAASGTFSGVASGFSRGIFTSGEGSATGAGVGAVAGSVKPGDTLTLILDGAQRPVSFTATGSDGARVTATALKAPELSSSDGILFWGRWTDTKFQFDVQDPAKPANAVGTGTVPAGSYLHYIVGLPAGSVPMAGVATYNFIGGSGSSAELGSVGLGTTAGTLTANFGANTVGANMTINHGGIYSASGLANLNANERAQFSSVNGTAVGPGGISPFKFDGFFAGAGAPTAPARAGVAWKIDKIDPIIGTAAFRCASGC